MFQTHLSRIIAPFVYLGLSCHALFMIVEGPIVTMIAAFLASLGYFNVAIVFTLSVAGM